ncbi:MAG: glycosyltransferase family 1 protein [Bryobacteraceae bacterium]
MSRPLRIGVNALFLIPGGVGGTEIYLREVMAALGRNPRNHQFFVFLNRETGPNLVPEHPAFHAVPTGVAATSRPQRLLYEQSGFLGRVKETNVDVLFNAGYTAPHFLRRPSVTVFFDMQHHHHPEFFGSVELLAWRFVVWSAARASRRILTISGASRTDIHEVYGFPLDRIDVAEPGVDPELLALQRRPSEPMVLYVSTLHPKKNHERLIDAFAEFRVLHPQYRMVLAGLFGSHHEAVKQRIAHHRLEEWIHITGWIPRADILDLYSRASIAVFPSLFEGFGIPVLEAMAAGVPLITSDHPPMSEAAGDGAMLFPATDPKSLTACLNRLASDAELRAHYVEKGRERVLRYSWDNAASNILDSLEKATMEARS